MIEVHDLTKEFHHKSVLHQVNFAVSEGEIFGYLGPNGAGKTTTMRIILGLLKPTSGKALVWGHDLGQDDEVRRRVGVLLEHDGVYERMSAYDNLDYYAQLYGVPHRRRKIEDLLELVGLSDRRKEKAGNFSRGMKRKLALARAIIHDPKVLFLDEPAAGLDPEAQKMVRDLILRLSSQERMTVFLNSHDLDEVQRICSRVAILHKGRIEEYDTVQNLRNSLARPVVEIVLADADEAGKAVAALSALDYVLDYQRHSVTMTVTLCESERPSTLLASLTERGIKIEEIKRVVRSLEDVYLETVHQGE